MVRKGNRPVVESKPKSTCRQSGESQTTPPVRQLSGCTGQPAVGSTTPSWLGRLNDVAAKRKINVMARITSKLPLQSGAAASAHGARQTSTQGYYGLHWRRTVEGGETERERERCEVLLTTLKGACGCECEVEWRVRVRRQRWRASVWASMR